VAAIIGFCTMALLLPVQTFFSQQFGAIRKYTLKYTDQRIKTVNEILVGCEVMKLYNWYVLTADTSQLIVQLSCYYHLTLLHFSLCSRIRLCFE